MAKKWPKSLRIKVSEYVPLEETCSREFLQGMVNRMIVSHHKYGDLTKNYPHNVDSIASLKKRLKLYQQTGNTEWLLDVANQAMIEFMRPRHRKAHFRATSSQESPGLCIR